MLDVPDLDTTNRCAVVTRMSKVAASRGGFTVEVEVVVDPPGQQAARGGVELRDDLVGQIVTHERRRVAVVGGDLAGVDRHREPGTCPRNVR